MHATNGSGKNAQVCIGDGLARERHSPTAAIGTRTTSTGLNTGSLATSSVHGRSATKLPPPIGA